MPGKHPARPRHFHTRWPLLIVSSTVLGLTSLAGCDKGQAGSSQDPAKKTTATGQPKALDPIAEEVVAAMDPNIDPCDDFYAYACGGWIAQTELPPDESRYGRGFSAIKDRNDATVQGILAQAKDNSDPALAKAGNYYASCLDEAAIDARGSTPLDPYLARIDNAKNKKALIHLLGEFQAEGIGGGFFGVGFGFDDKNPDLVIAQMGQGGTGLPERSFYLEADKKPILDAYTQHVGNMLGFVGFEGEAAQTAARDVVAFETKLATAQVPIEKLRDPNATYNPMTPKEIDGRMKTIPFAKYLEAVGRPDLDRVIVSTPSFLDGLDAAFADTELDTLKAYMKWNVISDTAGLLSRDVREAEFQFTSALTGAKALPERWKECSGATTSALGDVVSQAFVKETFAGDSKQISTQMIKDVEEAFEAGLASLSWMDDATRQRAVEKMSAITNKIGYPDQWRKYDDLKVGASYFENAVAASAFNGKYYRDMIGGKTDRGMWFMPSAQVNAYYNPSLNEIVFPAGILQSPFFSSERPQSLNYGAIGMVMGHELTHGFDDSGRKYDGRGMLTEWWAPEVSARFETQAQCIADTYSKIEVQPGVHLNGELTMGENIADFGGIKQTYSAYQRWTERNGAETPTIEGMSNDQMLFLGYAQAWCSISTPEIDRLLATVDPHSPPKYRVNVPLAHSPDFWAAYGCSEGTAMHAENACTVW